ncbi:FadR/GntR family transcriptional regulator [soil metagenome]
MVSTSASPSLSPFEPVRRAPLSVLVSRQMRELIVSGVLPLGTPLPSEKALTEQFGVSRSTIREALRILQAQGLLSGGDTVSTARPHVSDRHVVESAALALEAVLRLGQVPLTDLVALRVVLEGAALEHAASDPGPEAIAEARVLLDAMRHAATAGDVAAFHTADVGFHIAMVGAGDNVAYRLVLGVLREAIAVHLLDALADLAEPAAVLGQLIGEHEAVLGAVEAGDGPAARHHVRAHILGFYAAHGQAGGTS